LVRWVSGGAVQVRGGGDWGLSRGVVAADRPKGRVGGAASGVPGFVGAGLRWCGCQGDGV